MIYKEWLDIWIEDSVRPVAKQRTYERYKDITLGHIAPLLGQYNLDSLTPSGKIDIFPLQSQQLAYSYSRIKAKNYAKHFIFFPFGNLSLECGMDVKTLAEILGHKNAVITLNRYVHSLMEHKQDMMDKVGKLLQ